MDLNSSPPLKDDEEFFKNHLEEDEALQDIKETSVQILRREREERRERLRRNLINNRPVLTEPSVCDEGPYSKKLKYDSHKLPPGWLDCPNFGHEIGFLIPSKVPLNESFNDYIVDKKRYSFRNVLRLLGHKLGMVVDLTNTDRYYQMTEVRGLKYLKIRCQGRHAIPDNESVNKFVFVCEAAWVGGSLRLKWSMIFGECKGRGKGAGVNVGQGCGGLPSIRGRLHNSYIIKMRGSPENMFSSIVLMATIGLVT